MKFKLRSTSRTPTLRQLGWTAVWIGSLLAGGLFLVVRGMDSSGGGQPVAKFKTAFTYAWQEFVIGVLLLLMAAAAAGVLWRDWHSWRKTRRR